DLDADEPPRQVADHRLRAVVARSDRGRDRRGRGRVGGGARRRAARTGPPVGGVHRSERGALPRSTRAGDARAGARSVRLVLNGRGGRVGAVLGPALETGGHTLVDSLDEADAMVDFTAPDAVLANVRAAVAAGVPCVVGTTGWDPTAVSDAGV